MRHIWHWVLLPIMVCALLALPMVYFFADDELCRLLEARLAAGYPHLQVSVRSALFVPGEGIQIRGIVVSDNRLPRPYRQLAYVAECWLVCRTQWQELLHGSFEIQRVRLLQPRVRLTRLSDGKWSAAGLWPLPQFCKRPPPVAIEGGTVELYDVQSGSEPRYVLKNVCLSVVRCPIDGSQPQFGRCPTRIAGTLVAPHARSISLGATLLPGGQGQLEIRYAGLELSTELASLLPELAAGLPRGLPTARAELDGRAEIHWSSQQPSLQVTAKGTLRQGMVAIPRMPWPLSDVRASFRYDGQGLHLQGVTARFGQASVHLDHARIFLAPELRYEIQGQCRRLRFDPRLVEALPATLRRQCHRYRASGEIDVRHFMAAWDGRQWQYTARVQCLNVGLVYQRFPYPLEGVRGMLDLDANVLRADLQAGVDGEQVSIRAEVHVPRVRAGDWVEIRTGRIALDEKLLAALDDRSEPFVRALQPQGRIKAFARFEWGGYAQPTPGMHTASPATPVAASQDNAPQASRWAVDRHLENTALRAAAHATPPDTDTDHSAASPAAATESQALPPSLHRTIAVKFDRCAIKYTRFPYAVEEVSGTATMRGKVWHLDRLEGRHGSARIVCTGQVNLGSAGAEWRLLITGRGLALNDELRAALHPANQRLWDMASPQGACDVEALLLTSPGGRHPRLRIRARPLNDGTVVTAIEPRPFPYRLERLEGLFTFQDGALHFERVRARHGRTLVSGKGHCQLDGAGGWRLHFEHLAVDQLAVDRDLLEAVQGRLKRALVQLRVRGTLNLQGQLEVASASGSAAPFHAPSLSRDTAPSNDGAPSHDAGRSGHTDAAAGGRPASQGFSAAWDLAADLHDVSLDCGFEVEHVFGAASFAGRWENQRLVAHGDLNLESAAHGDYQVTQIRGPIWLDEGQVLLGVWADRHRRVLPQRHVTCQAYGGRAHADLWVKLEPQPRYAVNVTLADADLARLAREAIPGSQRVAGRIMATIELRGSGRSTYQLGGHGTLSLLEADLYELPQMVALLKLLSVRPPDPTAFTESQMAFRIAGEHVYFDDFRLCGDAISLLGKGEMNFNQQLDLTLHAMVGRQRQRIPVLSELMGGASQQIMLIHVGGTLANVELRREPFPVVSQAVQQLNQGLRR